MAIDRNDQRQVEAARLLVAQYLNEALATETALVTTLQTHVAITPRGDYRDILERHLGETRAQAQALQGRLGELGARGNIVTATLGLAETVVGQALAIAKGPIDLLRGASGEEKLLKNAKDECATEALEIATYDALEALARAVGDEGTAALAVRHREQEERMLQDLRAIIPALTEATVKARAGGESSYDVRATGAADAVRAAARTAGESARTAAESAQGAARTAADSAQEAARTAADSTQEAARTTADSAQEAARTARGRARAATKQARERSADSVAPPPIEGYDGLTAGQVVSRMAGLSQPELQAVADYERAKRNRRTVLARVESLLVPVPWPGYDDQEEAAVLERLDGADRDTATRVRDYEAKHRRRVTVLEAAQRALDAR